jgi:DOPA 4,5-dioxygenase
VASYREDTSTIAGYDGRIEFADAPARVVAEWLAARAKDRFGLPFSAAGAGAIGFRIPAERFPEVAPFLAMNRTGLRLAFRPDGRPEATVCTYDGGPRASPLQENPNRPVSWHFHIYFPSAEIDKAHWLHDTIARRFRVGLYPVEDGAGGPHPLPNLEIQVSREEFPKVLPWMALNRQGLSVHVHPRSEDLIGDHIVWPLWLGKPIRLIEAELDGMRPPGADEGLALVNGAPGEPPSPDKRFPPTA